MSASDPGFYVCAPVSVVLLRRTGVPRGRGNISLDVTAGRAPRAVVQDGDSAWWVSVRDCARSTFSILFRVPWEGTVVWLLTLFDRVGC